MRASAREWRACTSSKCVSWCDCACERQRVNALNAYKDRAIKVGRGPADMRLVSTGQSGLNRSWSLQEFAAIQEDALATAIESLKGEWSLQVHPLTPRPGPRLTCHRLPRSPVSCGYAKYSELQFYDSSIDIQSEVRRLCQVAALCTAEVLHVYKHMYALANT